MIEWSYDWLEAIPPTTLDDVLRYVADCWEELRIHWPLEHCFTNDEPRLTLSLSEYLNDRDRRRSFGISGSFSAEALEPVRVNGRVEQHGRTDIKFTYGQLGAPELTIECKKLDGSATHRRLYCTNGIKRFVSGKYARSYSQGVMLGFACDVVTSEIDALKQYMQREDIIRLCKTMDLGEHGVICEPSELSAIMYLT